MLRVLALALSLLGEMELVEGSVAMRGSVAYTAQSAFLSNATSSPQQSKIWDITAHPGKDPSPPTPSTQYQARSHTGCAPAFSRTAPTAP